MQGYDAWQLRYARTFALTRPEDEEMFAEWESAFDGCGFTADDLQTATNELVANPPQTRSAHLRALMTGCKKAQAEKRQSVTPDFGSVGPCALCLSSGWVIVPHVGTMRGTLRRYHTMAVTCMCSRGRVLSGVNLEQYERQNPEWRRWAAEHEEDTFARLKLPADPGERADELARRCPTLARAFENALKRMPPREWGRRPPAGQSIEEWLREEVG